MNTLILVCGLPNAGKTTYCEQYENVIHLDSIESTSFEDKFNKCIHQAAQAEGDVVIDGNFFSSRIRQNLLNAFKDRDYKKICVWVNTPFDICLERARNGGRDETTVNHIYRYFDDPTLEEGWDELICTYTDEN